MKKREEVNQQHWAAMTSALTSFTGNVAASLTDVLSGAKTWAQAMTDMATSTAKSMARAFLDGLFSPLTDLLKQAGKQFADWASGALGSIGKVSGAGSSSSAGGAAGGLGSLGSAIPIIGGAIALGGIIGSLFGGSSQYQDWVKAEQNAGYTVVSQGLAEKLDGYGNATSATWYTGSYETGTPSVPQTGPAFLHQGERVVTASDNQQLVPLLQAILTELQKSGTIVLNGAQVGTALYGATRNAGMSLAGVR